MSNARKTKASPPWSGAAQAEENTAADEQATAATYDAPAKVEGLVRMVDDSGNTADVHPDEVKNWSLSARNWRVVE